jgi:hypothetical protein
MKHRRLFGLAVALLFAVPLCAALSAQTAYAKDDKDKDAGVQTLACARFWGEARNTGYGYSHIVHVKNECTKDVVCNVSTDVNPQVTNVAVPIGQEVEINTFYASPYSAFTPQVVCVAPADKKR